MSEKTGEVRSVLIALAGPILAIGLESVITHADDCEAVGLVTTAQKAPRLPNPAAQHRIRRL